MHEIEAFLIREAELLDEWKLDSWLELFAEDAAYWIPISPDQTSGRDQLSHIFDDRGLLEMRVNRAQHSLFHAQKPPSRTVHLVSNVRLPEDQPNGAVAVLSNQLITEYRNARIRLFSATCRHELVRDGGAGWRIRQKRIDLIDADGVQEGITIIL